VKIFDGTLSTLERSLDARLTRHEVLAGNLANANTPGFTPRDVDFAAAMAAASPGAPGAPEAIWPVTVRPPTASAATARPPPSTRTTRRRPTASLP
jgi:flagellar basal-body rod protein FlgB